MSFALGLPVFTLPTKINRSWTYRPFGWHTHYWSWPLLCAFWLEPWFFTRAKRIISKPAECWLDCEGILELIGTYTCVPGSWQLKIFRVGGFTESSLTSEVTSLVPLVLLGWSLEKVWGSFTHFLFQCWFLEWKPWSWGSGQNRRFLGWTLGVWVWKLDVSHFFLVRCRSGCWLPALLEVSSQQLHCLSVESQNNDPGGLFHVLKSWRWKRNEHLNVSWEASTPIILVLRWKENIVIDFIQSSIANVYKMQLVGFSSFNVPWDARSRLTETQLWKQDFEVFLNAKGGWPQFFGRRKWSLERRSWRLLFGAVKSSHPWDAYKKTLQPSLGKLFWKS